MDVDRLEVSEARRFAVAVMLAPAAFIVSEVLILVAISTGSDRLFVVAGVWMLGTLMPLSFYQIHVLATISEVTPDPSLVKVWVTGPWMLALGNTGRRLHRRAGLGPRWWWTQVGLNVLAVVGVVGPLMAIAA